jgi:4-diphosphocytidyl-2-C-methyl-D-erythritol kinase
VKARAYAKVNLGLEVLFRRQDGYHELRTILQTVDLHDRLTLEPRRSGIELEVDDASQPAGSENLVVRAAELLAGRIGRPVGVRIELEKRIPVGHGLGGGSADAAVTLLALNELRQAGLSDDDLRLLAAALGMDVPFFLHGGTALGIGRGDEVFPLAFQVDVPIVLILPDFAISTAAAYRNLILTKRESSLKLQSFASSSLGGGNGLPDLTNDLEAATREHLPSINGYKQILLELGAVLSLMSGSGSAVYGVFDDEAVTRSAARSLAERGIRAIATRTLTGKTYRERRLEHQPQRSGSA